MKYCLVLFVLFISHSSYSKAKGHYYSVGENFYIYKKPTSKRKIRIYEGLRLFVYSGKSKKWKKVKLQLRGKVRYGYIRVRDFNKLIEDKEYGTFGPSEKNSYWGAKAKFTYLSQGPRTISSSQITDGKVNSLSSGQMDLNFFYEWWFRVNRKVQIFVGPRTVKLKGKTIVDSTENESFVNMNFLSLGFIYKFYKDRWSPFWWGLGAEYAKGLNIEMSLEEGTLLATTSDDITNFYFMSLNSGYNHKISNSWMLEVDGQLGAVMNGEPIIFNLELGASLIYNY